MSTVSDSIKFAHGKIVRERRYPQRDAVLRQNAEMQKADAVKPTDGLRAFANFPPHELERLAEKGRSDRDTPSWYTDLTCPDAQIRSNAIKRLVNSSEGREYRVGGTNRKTFFIKNNPLARGK